MSYFGDPIGDAMSDRIENKIRSLLVNAPGLSEIQVFYRGDPVVVPVKLYPFCWLLFEVEREAHGENGYDESTGMRYFYYDGTVTIEILAKDALGIMPIERLANVPSHLESKALTQGAMQTLLEWGGPSGNLEDDPVTSADGKEQTVEFLIGTIRYSQRVRPDGNVSNYGSVDVRIFTRRITF